MGKPSPKVSKSWRDVLPVHPAAELFPRMSEDELRELGEDIKANGWTGGPVVLHEGKLLDGRNRLDAMELVGIGLDWSDIKRLQGVFWQGLGALDPYDFVISANLHRRHLTSEQKRDLIAKMLKAKPEASNAAIAKQAKADDKTVGKVRTELEGRSEIPNVKTRTDSKGRKQPAKKGTKASTAAKVKTPAPVTSKPTTAHDVIELWMQMPPEEDRRVFEAIGLCRILAGLPEAWMPELEKWIEECRSPAPPAELGPGHQIPDDLSIPEFMRRSA